jgi:hypothetical protein
MPIRIPDGFAQITTHCRLPGSLGDFHSVFGAEALAAPTQGVADSISGLFGTAWKSWLQSAASYLGCTVIWGPSNDPTRFDSTSGAGAGAGSGAAKLPPINQGILSKRSALGTRQGRGRTFVPGVDEGDVGDSGIISGSTLTALSALATNLSNACDDGVRLVGQVLLHSNTTDPTPVTSFTAESKISHLTPRYHR